MAEYVNTLIVAATLAIVIGFLILTQALLTFAVHRLQRTLVADWARLRSWWRRHRGRELHAAAVGRRGHLGRRQDDVRLPRPDLVLLDLSLGGGEKNWRFLRQLKEHPATATIPVLVCAEALSAVPNGDLACGILRKPVDLETFLRQTDARAEPSRVARAR